MSWDYQLILKLFDQSHLSYVFIVFKHFRVPFVHLFVLFYFWRIFFNYFFTKIISHVLTRGTILFTQYYTIWKRDFNPVLFIYHSNEIKLNYWWLSILLINLREKYKMFVIIYIYIYIWKTLSCLKNYLYFNLKNWLIIY